uniref:Uncharacterized protein n=1 Tax=Arundo donax TaxID=35708 RepID=A0A0A9B1F5_ARUDO
MWQGEPGRESGFVCTATRWKGGGNCGNRDADTRASAEAHENSDGDCAHGGGGLVLVSSAGGVGDGGGICRGSGAS